MLHRQLREGGLDVGFSTVAPDEVDLEHRPFADDKLVVIVPPRHRLAGRTARLREVAGESVIVRDAASVTGSFADRRSRKPGCALEPVLSLGSTEAVKQAVMSGLGVAIVSKLAVEADLKARRMSHVRFST